jgi:hypothetical protein
VDTILKDEIIILPELVYILFYELSKMPLTQDFKLQSGRPQKWDTVFTCPSHEISLTT